MTPDHPFTEANSLAIILLGFRFNYITAHVRSDIPNGNDQSQSLSRSYGSILPISLTYFVLSTRGYSPWRPDAVMGTTLVMELYHSLAFSWPPTA